MSSGRSASSDKKLQQRSFSTQKSGSDWSRHKSSVKQQPLRCYLCDSPNHLAQDCRARKSESQGKKTSVQEKKENKMIRTRCYADSGRECHCVQVNIEGVPVTGLIDTGSDITIVRGDLLYHIVSTAGLEESNIKPADQKACTYDQQPLTLDGQVDLNISFGEKALCTTVYIKVVAPDSLLLSESVCRNLGVVSFHPNVQVVQKGPVAITHVSSSSHVALLQDTKNHISTERVATMEGKPEVSKETCKAGVPAIDATTSLADTVSSIADSILEETLSNGVNDKKERPSLQESSTTDCVTNTQFGTSSRVSVIKTVHLPANFTAIVPVQVKQVKGLVMLEPSSSLDSLLKIAESLIEIKENGSSAMVITNK